MGKLPLTKDVIEGSLHLYLMGLDAKTIARNLGYSNEDCEALGEIAGLTSNMLDTWENKATNVLRDMAKNPQSRVLLPDALLRLFDNPNYLNRMLEIYCTEIKPRMLAESRYRE
jgi:hypothetical protein